MSLYEVTEAASLIQEEAHEDANIIFGAVIDERLADEIRITVIATGFGDLATRYNPRYSSSGAPITAPIQAAATRPVVSCDRASPRAHAAASAATAAYVRKASRCAGWG